MYAHAEAGKKSKTPPRVQRQADKELQLTRAGKTARNELSPLARMISNSRRMQTSPTVRLSRLIRSGIQTKLSISQPADQQEQDANNKASRVMRSLANGVQRSAASDDPTLQTQTLIQTQDDREDQVRPKPLLQRQDDTEQALQTNPELHRQAEEPDAPIQAQSGPDEVTPQMENQLDNSASTGQALPESIRAAMEPHYGDLSGVKIHTDRNAAQMNKQIKAQAFTKGRHIYFDTGKYNPETAAGKKLLAHELTHVVQQGAIPSESVAKIHRFISGTPASTGTSVRRQPTDTGNPADADNVAPGVVELKGQPQFNPSTDTADWLNTHRKGKVRVAFGSSQGLISVKKLRNGYSFTKQAVPFSHPLFSGLNASETKLHPNLVLTCTQKNITGFVSLGPPSVTSTVNNLRSILNKYPDVIGLSGFQFPKLPKPVNMLRGGKLSLGLQDVGLSLGGAFSGSVTIIADDVSVTSFQASADLSVQGLADAKLGLNRAPNGVVTGKVTANLKLPKNFSGGVDISWDGKAVSGQGKVGYTGEKFSGELILGLMEAQQAKQLEDQKKAPPDANTPAASKTSRKNTKGKKNKYVVFGEGDLTFSFTDWLTGTAHVIVDPKGFVTVIGKITPQKEFELFPQKDYTKQLFKLEARAAYGIPVVGNIFIFANIGMDAFAKLGPAKLYKIEIDGTYSTDPEKAKSFSIRGSLNISAAAGLKLRGEAGAGLEILAHDIKAGAGINGIAAIRGYAEANPIIGYREKTADKGQDKKGEFFIRGEMEIAAQPFLGLSGDLFVEIDAPWWSPCPDKKWTWPLGGKEWPIGGSLGVGATIDYVFGSGQAPAIDIKPAEFSADKFLTDLYSDKAKSKSGGNEKKPGVWKEKNSRTASPPPKKGKEGNAKVGQSPELPPASSKVKAGGPKKSTAPADPNARTAEGKSVKGYQNEATQKGEKPKLREPAKGNAQEDKRTAPAKTEGKDQQWQTGIKVVLQALEYARKTGIGQKELNQILKSIRKQRKLGFTELYARENEKNENEWIIIGSMSPEKPITTVLKDTKDRVSQKLLEEIVSVEKIEYVFDASLDRAKGPAGHVLGVKKGESRASLPSRSTLENGMPVYHEGDHRGHLIGDRFKGPAVPANLVPMSRTLNLSKFKAFEDAAAKEYRKLKPPEKKGKPALLYMKVIPKYPSNDKTAPESYRPISVTAEAKVIGLKKEGNDIKKTVKTIPKDTFPNDPGGMQEPPQIPWQPKDLEEAYRLAKEMQDRGDIWNDIARAFNTDDNIKNLKSTEWIGSNISKAVERRNP
jgi:hypothetical protein